MAHPVPIRVLVIDDSHVVGLTVAQALHAFDAQVHHCTDPKQAVTEALDFKPTVVLLDLHMPGLDGLAVARQFRRNEQLQGLPIVVLSMAEKADEKAAAFATGADDYLVKWPDEVELRARLEYHSRAFSQRREREQVEATLRRQQAELEFANQLLSGANEKLKVKSGTPEVTGQPSTPSLPKDSQVASGAADNQLIKVFLVDDSPLVGEVVKGALEGLPGCKFRQCTKPRRAVEQARSMEPTVILLDLKMPGVDGLSVAEQLQAEETLQSIPIIVLTVEQDAKEKMLAFETGAHDYLVKWPHEGELLARIRHHSSLYLKRKHRQEEVQALKVQRQELEWSNQMLSEANSRLKKRDQE